MSETDSSDAARDQGQSSDQEGLSSLSAEIDQRFRETREALREQAERLQFVEQRIPGETAETAVAPDTRTIWEDTVRRFTGSIDIRLDILEDQLGGLEDELSRLQQTARERVDAAQRRLVRLYAVGQVSVGILILGLYWLIWPGLWNDSAPEPPPVAPADISMAQRPASGPEGSAATAQEPPAPTSRRDPGAAVAGGAAPSPGASPGKPAAQGTGRAEAPKPEAADLPTEQRSADPPGSQQSGDSGKTGEQAAQEAAPAGDSPGTDTQQEPLPKKASTPGGAEDRSGAPGDDDASDTGSPADSKNATSDAEPDAKPAPPEGERFAIQLIAYQSESNVRRFVEKFDILDDARFMHYQSQGQDWYVVFLGDYATRADGAAAMAALPKRLRELEPWVRSLPPGTELTAARKSAEATSN